MAPGCSDDVPSTGGDDVQPETGSDSGSDESSSSESGSDGESDSGPLSCAELPGPWDYGASIPMPESPGGDPVAGLDALLNNDYVSCGIPWTMFPIAQPFLGSFGSGPPLPWREGKNADVPIGWTVQELGDGSEMVAPNCFQCHAAELNGELVLGLGRHDFDFTNDLYSLIQLVPALPPLNDAGAPSTSSSSATR
ncbi:MAG: hypothetical protein KC457_07535 [Myxococcales bacterium]|nr:hypothetical protein [Myxococcales bacterium]